MSAHPTPAIRVRGLARRYGAVEALGGVSLEVAPGEVLGLLGPNGAGKTTCIECILGLRRPDSGEIEIAGIDARRDPAAALASLGAVLQSATLQDSVTPRKALALFAAFYGAAPDGGGLLLRFGLSGKADARFSTLSSGLRQRLFLALAFVNSPAVMVLDEPTTGLDPASRRELHGLIAGLRSEGRSVLLSTHDLEEAERLCDRVAVMSGGRIIAEARPSDLRSAAEGRPALEFTVEPPMPEWAVLALAAVTSCQGHGGTWRVSSTDLTRTVQSLSESARALRARIVDLRVMRPSLEEVFLEITRAARDGGTSP